MTTIITWPKITKENLKLIPERILMFVQLLVVESIFLKVAVINIT